MFSITHRDFAETENAGYDCRPRSSFARKRNEIDTPVDTNHQAGGSSRFDYIASSASLSLAEELEAENDLASTDQIMGSFTACL